MAIGDSVADATTVGTLVCVVVGGIFVGMTVEVGAIIRGVLVASGEMVGFTAVGVREAGIGVAGTIVGLAVTPDVGVGPEELNWIAPISSGDFRGLPKKSVAMPRSMAPPLASDVLPGR